jgi:molybdopterin-guanine dinucleotide biosynthesis protein B
VIPAATGPADGVPVVSVVGRKNSGKTTLVEGIVRDLTRRGYRVGTIKHDAHAFEIDHEGKDSWRHRRAGAQTVVISSASQMAMIKSVPADPGLHGIVRSLFDDVDIVIAEGYRATSEHKVEVVRAAISHTPLCSEGEVLAFVSDVWRSGRVPCFSLTEVEALVELLLEQVVRPNLGPVISTTTPVISTTTMEENV